MRLSSSSLVLVAVALGCSGGSFDTAVGAEDSSSDVSGDGVTIDSGGDTTVDTSPPPDTTPPPDGTPCAPLGPGVSDVFVDKRYLGTAPTGTATCPFTTILAGLGAIATLGATGIRTLHVAGATPALVYNESDKVLVNHKVVLVGDGPTKTTISATGACNGGGNCAVEVNLDGVLDGFTVTSPGGDGIVANAGSPAAVIKNVSAIGSKLSGIVTLGAAELGPNIVASGNFAQGLASKGVGGLLHVNGGTNAFDGNAFNGITVDGSATLKFEGGTASGNGYNGIRLAGTITAPPTAHAITNLVAKLNKNTGISAFNGQTLTIRSSTLLTNSNVGLWYGYAGTGTLDLGITTDAGGNTFGGSAIAARNGKAGIFLCKSRGSLTQPAHADLFANCPPTQTQTSLTTCDPLPTTYFDVAYMAATSGDPVNATSCTLGP
jgi:hypothetical protein